MKNWVRRNKTIITGQFISVLGLGGLMYLTTIAGFVKSPEAANYIIWGWICGGLMVGGVALVIIKGLEDKIEKFRNENEQNGDGKIQG